MATETQVRATFNDTKQAQEKLRLQLDKYEENNIYVGVTDRSFFFDLVADALLGLDYGKGCILHLPNKVDSLYINNLGEFLRYLIYYDKNIIDNDFLGRYDITTKVNFPIKYLWHELKFIIFGIYPEALTISIRMSKEREKREKSEGASIEQIQRSS